MRARAFVAVATVLMSAGGGAQGKEQAPGSLKLPAPARAVVSRRMITHAEDMNALVMSVLLLDYWDAEHAAARIGRGTKMLDRRDPAVAKLSEWFAAQDRLERSAEALADAASRRNAADMTASFQQVVSACVSCHSAYLDAYP